MDRPHRRALRQLQDRVVHALPPRPRPGVPDQLEGVRRELERRLPRAVRASPPELAAQVARHRRAPRAPPAPGRFAARTCSANKPHPDGVDLTDGRTDLDQETSRGHFADYIYPN